MDQSHIGIVFGAIGLVVTLFYYVSYMGYRKEVREPKDLLTYELTIRTYPDGCSDYFLGEELLCSRGEVREVWVRKDLVTLKVRPNYVFRNQNHQIIPDTPKWRAQKASYQKRLDVAAQRYGSRIPSRVYATAPYAYEEERYSLTLLSEVEGDEPTFF